MSVWAAVSDFIYDEVLQESKPMGTCKVYQWRLSNVTYRCLSYKDMVIFHSKKKPKKQQNAKELRWNCGFMMTLSLLHVCKRLHQMPFMPSMSTPFSAERCWVELMNFILLMSVFDLQPGKLWSAFSSSLFVIWTSDKRETASVPHSSLFLLGCIITKPLDRLVIFFFASLNKYFFLFWKLIFSLNFIFVFLCAAKGI